MIIDGAAIRAEAEAFFNPGGGRHHAKVLQEILDSLEPVDFREIGDLKPDDRIPQKAHIVLTVQAVLAKAKELNCGLCKNQDFVYSYNGEFWQLIDKDALENFLGEAAERVGVDTITARYHRTKKELVNQFLSDAYLPKPEVTYNRVLINLRNGTFEVGTDGFRLRGFDPDDFLTYQLPFGYLEVAGCPKWKNFLSEVLPDENCQAVLAEFVGYIFARHLKLEKTLILYGTGANGKSVVFDVITALLGSNNISNISLESISKDQYYRAMLANKLLNYAPEISNKLQAEKFKQLTSGEPIEARLPYGQPMTLRDYARLAFNSNDLPRDVEHTEAFFRRFLIIPFGVTIPEQQRNPNLAKEIIRAELSAVFNWILEGLQRLLTQPCSQCPFFCIQTSSKVADDFPESL
ncbi:MAG TPA: phage/plasmid primase, P4 family [Pyrinomonadaceae bacterium]|jgi:putative DNA primase/helicase|nr:phage/plasmid primase, P4 family [Pyrinomonadaceae bacterium]